MSKAHNYAKSTTLCPKTCHLLQNNHKVVKFGKFFPDRQIKKNLCLDAKTLKTSKKHGKNKHSTLLTFERFTLERF